MSSMEKQEVWRVPLRYCGIADNRYGASRGAVGDEYDPDCVLDFVELQEEYAELFGYDVGKFKPSACAGSYLDFLLYQEYEYTWDASRQYVSTPKSVFEKILPDIDLDDVHYCDYEWYNGTDAPEVY